MKKLTLQWRITILAALVLAACSVALTVLSILNAERSFVALMEESTTVYSVAGQPPESGGQTAVPGVQATPAQLAKRKFDSTSLLVCVLVTALGSTATYLAAGKALRPLRELTKAAGTVDEHTLSQRLPEAASQDEVGALTHSFNEMLARLDDAFLRQKRFTANAAHELKTPLATLKTGVQVLSADRSATLEDYKEQAQNTLTSVDRLSCVVDDLLLLASAGETVGREQEEILLEPLFEAIESELCFQLEQKEMTCRVDCGEFSVIGNPSMLYRVFFNLVENACKYGRQRGQIQISAQRSEDSTCIFVKDDGPGIGAEHLPYIFDAFYRVDKSRSREMGGSGLGLSLVKTMVEAQGGQITVDSDGATETCFIVTLPN